MAENQYIQGIRIKYQRWEANGRRSLDSWPHSSLFPILDSKSQPDFRTKQHGLLEDPPFIDVFPIKTFISSVSSVPSHDFPMISRWHRRVAALPGFRRASFSEAGEVVGSRKSLRTNRTSIWRTEETLAGDPYNLKNHIYWLYRLV